MRPENALRARGWWPIVEAICHAHYVTSDELLGTSRVTHIVRARYALYSAMRDEGLSYSAIGGLLGRDHTTILEGVRRHGEIAAARTENDE